MSPLVDPKIKAMQASMGRIESILDEMQALLDQKEKVHDAMQPLWQKLLARGSK